MRAFGLRVGHRITSTSDLGVSATGYAAGTARKTPKPLSRVGFDLRRNGLECRQALQLRDSGRNDPMQEQ
jgi:hypothetical protein